MLCAVWRRVNKILRVSSLEIVVILMRYLSVGGDKMKVISAEGKLKFLKNQKLLDAMNSLRS